MDGNQIFISDSQYSENLLNDYSTFEDDTDAPVKSGGVLSATAAYSQDQSYEGTRSVKCYNSDKVTPLSFNFGTLLRTLVPRSGNYFLVLRIFHVEVDAGIFTVNIKMNGSVVETMICNLVGTQAGEWQAYFVRIPANGSDLIDFTFEHAIADANFSTVYIDALELKADDRNQAVPSAYSKPSGSWLTPSA